MADKKISALTGASTPLAGTEVLPIVQSGSTVKVAVSDLTAGRAVSASSLSANTTNVFAKINAELSGGNAVLTRFNSSNKPAGLYTTGGSGESFFGANLDWSSGNVFNYKLNGLMWYMGDTGGSGTTVGFGIASGTAGASALVDTGANVKFKWDTSGDYTLVNGNVVIGTSGKGIDFSATPGTGTSELLADYEEGTWTPNQGSGLTIAGTFYSLGQYTKVGRLVTASGYVAGTTTASAAGLGVITSNLPFTVGPRTIAGSIFVTGSVPAATTCAASASSTEVYNATAIAATTGQIYFNVTYEV
jgi:hypothetical protein